jgi:hypothetical protein
MNPFSDLTSKFKSISELDVQFNVKEGLSFTSKVKATPHFKRPQQADAKITTEVAEERAAAEQRADAVLEQLPQGYFRQEFDALEFELLQLSEDSKQDDVDVVVERLTAAVEVRPPPPPLSARCISLLGASGGAACCGAPGPSWAACVAPGASWLPQPRARAPGRRARIARMRLNAAGDSSPTTPPPPPPPRRWSARG